MPGVSQYSAGVAALPDCSDGPHRQLQCVDIRLADATSPRAAPSRCAGTTGKRVSMAFSTDPEAIMAGLFR